MSLKCWIIQCVFLMAFFCELLSSAACLPWLSPAGITAITLNSSLTLTCNYTGLVNAEDNFYISVLKDGLTQGRTWYNCKRPEGALHASVYNFTCPDLNLQSITIKRVGLALHDTTWTCTLQIPIAVSLQSINALTIVIKVPVATATVTFPSANVTTLTEGVTSPFECKTSASRPEATVVWYKKGVTADEQVITQTADVSNTVTTDNLTITTSRLTFNVSRKDMNYKIYCKASNSDSDTVISEHQPTINVLYGPTQTNVFCLSGNRLQPIDGGFVQVINGDTLTPHCLSNGDPQPDYTWNGQHGQNVTISILQDNLIYNCTASNVLQPDYGSETHMMDSKKVRIIRQYAPETNPTIAYTLSDGRFLGKLKSSLSVVENASFLLTCGNSSSVPTPVYQWTGEMNSTTGHLHVKSIKRSTLVDYNGASYYDYTCEVLNTMTNTCGDKRTQIGKSDHTLRVNVLFATVLDTVPGQSILEGEHLSLTATVIVPGSPRGIYKWLYHRTDTSNTTEIADSLSETLHNISRNQAGFYTIVVTNHISPTGQTSYKESVNRTFYLDVFYPSNVSLFTINEQNDTCTVNENTTVIFVCGVDSHPLSVVYINATTYNGERRLTTLLTAQQVEHTLQIATCYDSGLYRCIGQNNYSSKPVSLDNQLLVRCKPRPRYDVGQNITFHTALGSAVTLNLTLIAFPEPPADRFKWEKVDGENITEIINSTHIQITTTGLTTNLTIYRLKQTEFGQYRLFVNNTYIHYFYISPQDPPEMPTNFANVEDRLTETSAVLKWRPGFDGGLRQTFYIWYRKLSDLKWSYMNVVGLNVTLRNLVPSTLYYVTMFASNSIGNSSETGVFNITTQSRADDAMVASTSTAIGGAVGGLLALIVLVAVVVFILVRRKKQDKQPETDGYEIPQSRTVSSENENGYNALNTVTQTESDHTFYYNLDRSPYEDLTQERVDIHAYGTLNISEDNSKLSTDKLYENLRLSPMR